MEPNTNPTLRDAPTVQSPSLFNDSLDDVKGFLKQTEEGITKSIPSFLKSHINFDKPSDLLSTYQATGDSLFLDKAKEAYQSLPRIRASVLSATKAVAGGVDITPDLKNKPVLAYGKATPAAILGGAIAGAGLLGASKVPSMFQDNSKYDYTAKESEPKVKPEQLEKFKEGIGHAETSIVSGDPYKHINKNKNGTKDYGRYGINDSFFKSPGLMERYAGKKVTPKEVLSSRELQDKIVKTFAEYWLSKGETPEEVARMWTAGASSSQRRPQYIRNFNSIFKR